MLLIDFLGKKGGPISCIFATNYNSAIIRKEWKQVLMKRILYCWKLSRPIAFTVSAIF